MEDSISVPKDGFGYWLSGFADGEGSFILRCPRIKNRFQPSASFRIALRDDDADILYAIKAFLGCGYLGRYGNIRSKVKNAKPVMIFSVTALKSHLSTVIPHFEKYPLLAKKRSDFLIWKEAVLFMKSIQDLPTDRRPGQRGGTFPKWNEARMERFLGFRDSLRSNRVYVAS